MALGMTQLKADGVPSSEFVLGESQARDGQALLSAHFPGGSGTPAVVIASEEQLQDVADVLLATDGRRGRVRRVARTRRAARCP